MISLYSFFKYFGQNLKSMNFETSVLINWNCKQKKLGKENGFWNLKNSNSIKVCIKTYLFFYQQSLTDWVIRIYIFQFLFYDWFFYNKLEKRVDFILPQISHISINRGTIIRTGITCKKSFLKSLLNSAYLEVERDSL